MCIAFCGPHPVFDWVESAVRFESVDEAVNLIGILSAERPVGIIDQNRQWISDNCSLAVFRRAFMQLVSSRIF